MTQLNSPSSLVAFGFILLYGIFTIYRAVVKGSNSIKDVERIHRFMLVTSGVLIMLGINSLDLIQDDVDLLSNSEFYFGILLTIAGITFMAFGKFYLQNLFYKPLEQISEFSAEFGTRFVGTRIPETGVVELKSFARRFNNNALTLAHRLSRTEIQLERLRQTFGTTIDTFNNVSHSIYDLSGHIARNQDTISSYNKNLQTLQESSNTFIAWYEEGDETLRGLLSDLRSLTDLGNIIAVNAAIESVNMDEENPGFTTIATKLHEFSKTMEDRQVALNKYLREMQMRYDDYSQNVREVVNESDELISTAQSITADIDDVVYNLKQYDNDIMSRTDNLRLTLGNVIEDLPDAF